MGPEQRAGNDDRHDRHRYHDADQQGSRHRQSLRHSLPWLYRYRTEPFRGIDQHVDDVDQQIDGNHEAGEDQSGALDQRECRASAPTPTISSPNPGGKGHLDIDRAGQQPDDDDAVAARVTTGIRALRTPTGTTRVAGPGAGEGHIVAVEHFGSSRRA